MVMEAMRLSLMEHEEQQRKERLAEVKRQAEQGQGGAQSEGARTSTSTTDTTPPATALSATSPTESSSMLSPTSSEAPVTPDASSEGGHGSTGQSSAGGSVSPGLSTEQSPLPSPSGKKGKHKKGDGSIIGIALQAATNTASSVFQPSDGEGSAGPSGSHLTPSTSHPAASPVDPTTVPLPQSATPSPPTPTDPQPSGLSDISLPNPHSLNTPPLLSPNPDSSNSIVSSDGETAYDVLLSRTGSGVSNKPLIETPASDSTATSGITTNGSST